MATFIDSQRGGRKLLFEGYIYQQKRSDAAKTTWRCEKFQKPTFCRAIAVSQGQNVVVSKEHNHTPSPHATEKAKVKQAIKVAATASRDAPRAIVNNCLVGVSDGTIATMSKVQTMENRVRYERRKNRQAAIPHRLQDIVVPNNLQTRTANPEDFLLADTGSNDENRIIIFSCKRDRIRLANCQTWLADSTFKAAPEMFAQVWVIHGLCNN